MKTFCIALLYLLFTNVLAVGQDKTPQKFAELVQSKNYLEASNELKIAIESGRYDAAFMETLVNLSSENLLAIFDANPNALLTAFDAMSCVRINPRAANEFAKKLVPIQEKKKSEKDWNAWAMLSFRIINNCYIGDQFELLEKNFDGLYNNLEKIDSNYQDAGLFMGGNYYMGLAQNFEKAEQFFYTLLKLKQQGKLVTSDYPYAQLSDLYFRKRDYERSLEFANKVLSNPNIPLNFLIEQLLRAGYIHHQQNNYSKAREYYSQAKEKIPNTPDVIQNPFWNRLLMLYYAQNIELCIDSNRSVAKEDIESLTKVLASYSSADALTKAIRSLILYSTKNNDDKIFSFAANYMGYDRANLSINSPVYTAMGDYYTQKNEITKALEHYNRALDGLRGESKNGLGTYVFDEPNAFETLYKKTKLLMTQKKAALYVLDFPIEKLDEMIYQTAHEAIILLDELRKNQTTKSAQLHILEQTPYIYEIAIQIATELYAKTKDNKYLEQIYAFMEKSKAMLLADVLAENDAKEFGGVPEKYRKEEKQLQNDLKLYELELYKAQKTGNKHQVTTFENIVFEKRAALDDLKKKLEKEYPKYFQYKFNNPVAYAKDLQAMLQQHNAVFISYFIGKNNVYVLKIDNKTLGIRQIALPNNLIPNLELETRSFRAFLSDFAKISKITNDEYQKFTSQAHRFYRFLLEPELKDCKNVRLLLSFDGILHYIPAEVFLTASVKSNESMDYKSLPYLIRQFNISYTYNATLWLKAIEQQKNLKSTSGGILGMAATYKPTEINKNTEWGKVRSGLEELGGAKNEINYLKNTFLGQYWLDEQATEAQFLKDAPNHNIIHLALHGLVDGEMPMNSGVVFSDNGDTISNNILQAYELPNVSLNANLVILSACSTGDGQYTSGEGVMSLGRSFMYAGASSIMTSLWQLNDVSSEHLMRIFYQKLKDGLPKDEALQQAKLDYLAQAQGVAGHPAFWAALVLIGENSPVPVYSQWGTLWLMGGFAIFLLVAGVFWYRKK